MNQISASLRYPNLISLSNSVAQWASVARQHDGATSQVIKRKNEENKKCRKRNKKVEYNLACYTLCWKRMEREGERDHSSSVVETERRKCSLLNSNV